MSADEKRQLDVLRLLLLFERAGAVSFDEIDWITFEIAREKARGNG